MLKPAIAAALLVAAAAAHAAGEASVFVVPAREPVADRTQQAWSARWWQWGWNLSFCSLLPAWLAIPFFSILATRNSVNSLERNNHSSSSQARRVMAASSAARAGSRSR